MFQQLKQELEELPTSISPEAISVSSIMQFPPGLSKILLWILRRRSVGAGMVAEYMGQDEATAREMLEMLAQRGVIETTGMDPDRQYRIRVHSARKFNMMNKIGGKFDE